LLTNPCTFTSKGRELRETLGEGLVTRLEGEKTNAGGYEPHFWGGVTRGGRKGPEKELGGAYL